MVGFPTLVNLGPTPRTNESLQISAPKGLSSQEIQSIVAAWEAGAISRETMLDLFRRGEVLPEGRTNEEEVKLVGASAVVSTTQDEHR